MPNADGVPNCTSLGRLGQLSGFTVSDCSTQPPPPPPPPPTILQSNVRYQNTNGDVTIAQQALIDQGFGIAAGATGFFGDQTRAAMNSFETAVGSAQTGGFPTCFTLGALGGGTTPRFLLTCDSQPPPPPNDGEPVHNYTRFTYTSATGAVVNQRTADMLSRAVTALTAYSWSPYLTQGSYNPGGVAGSAGTHDGGGCVDIRISTMTTNGADLCVQALRRVGFAAWRRTEAEGFSPHIHAVAIGDREMSSAAANQVQDYFNGRNGLASNAADTLSSTYKTPVPMWPAWCNKYNF